MRSFVIGIIILLFSADGFAAEGHEYYKAYAQKGDGVYSLLRRYQLDKFACNHSEFYRINQLKKNTSLKAEQAYYVPLLIYTYNGKSIRSTIGVDDWDKAVRIQNLNKFLVDKGLFATYYEKGKKLLVPYHELHCGEEVKIDTEVVSQPVVEKEGEIQKVDEPIQNTSKVRGRNYPIFGKQYAYTPKVSNKLVGKVFYVVSGHGGPDPGAVGKRSKKELCEDEYAYDVALRVTRNLISHGATAYMIVRDENDGIRDGEFLKCDTDEIVWGGAKILASQKPRLFQRSNKINELYEKHKKQGVTDQRNIVIHVDSRGKRQRADVFFYYFPESKDGKKLAKKVHSTLKKKYRKYRRSRGYNGTVTARDLHMLRECKPTSVYIELGNIKNPNDQKRIVVKSNRQTLANWLFEGIIAN